MKRFNLIAIVALLSTFLSSCAAIEGIFKAGMWSGIIMVVLVVALIIWIVSKLFGGKG